MITEILGYVGGGLLGVQSLPQILKVLKTKSAGDISTTFLSLNITGLSLMFTYGLMLCQPPLFIPVGVSLVNSVVLMGLTLKFSHLSEEELSEV